MKPVLYISVAVLLYTVVSVADQSEAQSVAFDQVSQHAVEQRRRLLLSKCARHKLDLKAKSPKLQYPYILARLVTGKADKECIEYLPRGARYHGKDSMFGISSLARILAACEEQLPEEVVEDIRKQVVQYPDFLSGGTENHRAMKRAAGLIFGERWPDDIFHHGISGRELADVCRKFARDYGHGIYASSMHEYLSPVYHAANTAPWMTVAEYAQDEETRLLARAIVDWMMADLALNCHLGSIIPPLNRCKAQLKGYPGHSRLGLAQTMSTAWLYWGIDVDDIAVSASIDSASVPLHAQSGYLPHSVIRNLGAKRVALPYTVRQSRASKGRMEAVAANAYGYQARTESEDGAPEDRYNLRSVYLDRDYALGAGYFRENIFDPFYRTSIPFGAVWRSGDEYARLVVGHPYWYVNYKPKAWEESSPEDMWSGMSPFQQMVHCENAAVFLFNIPAVDPYKGTRLRWGPSWARPAPAEHPLQSCFAYYPESIDEKIRAADGFFLREGDVYIALRPLSGEAEWSGCAVRGYARIDMPGALTGCVVELGNRPEYGSFKKFQERVAAAKLDTTALASEKKVVYRSTRGHRLEIKYNEHGWMPRAAVDGKPLDYEHWPICESPYMVCRGSVLEVNDGKQGLTINWKGDVPVYTEYKTVGGIHRAPR
ncbi:MAG: hypothetical protein K9M45_01955 [Kiritimatiellales bacterium]|nr:hypothetical protein [Kiritimatiellales bacterium]